MYGQTPFDASKNSTAPKGLTALFLGFIVCYQVFNHIFMRQAVSNRDDDLESDAACAVGPGASLCMEAQLFKGWHEDSQLPPDTPAELADLLVASPSTSPEQPSPTVSATPSAPAAKDPSSTQALRGDVAAPQEAEAEDIKPEALEGLLWDLAWSMGGGKKYHKEAPEKHHKKPAPKPSAFMAKKNTQGPKLTPKKKSFANGLTDLQQKLEAKMQSQARKHAEHRRIRALSVAARGHSEDSASSHHHMTSWAANLDELTHDLQDEMKAWHKERAQHAAAQKRALKEDVMTPFAHNLEDMMHEMQDHMDVRDKERAEHAAAHAARLKAAHAASRGPQPESSPFMEEVDALGRELCQDPARRDRPACAQFMLSHSGSHAEERKTSNNVHDTAMAHIKLLEKHLDELEKDREHDNEDIRLESKEFLKELCADPARHSYPACARFLTSTSAVPAAAAAPARANMRGSTASPGRSVSKEVARNAASQPHALHWVAMTDSEATDSKHQQHMGASPLVMHRQDLLAHWEGKIPKVACITVLPQGGVTANLMRYFMDNYNLQHYDGVRELVIVYHAKDKEAARVAHLYADSTASVKAVAARAETGFPSATAYRYGAWLAQDADLVVRWDFEAFHHPNRLSMQVRAIALSKRPASLVPGVTAFDGEGKRTTVAGGVGNHGSLMGDAAWMRQHWMPVLEIESALLNGLQSSNVVQVAMPELLAYHDASMLGAAA